MLGKKVAAIPLPNIFLTQSSLFPERVIDRGVHVNSCDWPCSGPDFFIERPETLGRFTFKLFGRLDFLDPLFHHPGKSWIKLSMLKILKTLLFGRKTVEQMI